MFIVFAALGYFMAVRFGEQMVCDKLCFLSETCLVVGISNRDECFDYDRQFKFRSISSYRCHRYTERIPINSIMDMYSSTI